jgi:phosphoglycolate phosphatase-like HAD superfamily hydrolase
MKLALFDIDGTLLLGGGAGARAMTRAGQAVLGPAFTLDGIELGGALDSWIYEQAAASMGDEDARHRHDAFRESYLAELLRELEEGPPPTLLPGVMPLLARLEAMTNVTLGLVTGNYRDAVPHKLRKVGIDPARFAIGAFGDEGTTRPGLVRLAMTRWAERGHDPDPARVVVIGDTPRDVACARENGCRCFAVATGRYSKAELARAGADAVVDHLGEAGVLLDWLCG